MKSQSDWHWLAANLVAEKLGSDEASGLTSDQAGALFQKYGPNLLPPALKRSFARMLASELHNPLIYVLVFAGALTLYLRDFIDSAIIFAVVVLNAAIGLVQQGRAARELEKVSALLADNCLVIRDGEKIQLRAQELVPGDLLWLEAGDRCPADARLVTAVNLTADESLLTGESAPSQKGIEPVGVESPMTEQASMVFAGTTLTSGHAAALVVATGANTSLGHIGRLISQTGDLSTPMTRRLGHLAAQIAQFVLGLGLLVLLFGLLVNKSDFTFIFTAVVALAVAAIPEGLPAVVSITLAFGTRVLAKRGAVIRKLPAVEALGSVSVICTDKTGTLTENQMTVVEILTPTEQISVSGAGYAPSGFLVGASEPNQDSSWVQALINCCLLCNDAALEFVNGPEASSAGQADGHGVDEQAQKSDASIDQSGYWRVVGDPTEGALLALGAKAGGDRSSLQAAEPRIAAIPFNPNAKYMATLHARPENRLVKYAKGAPEVLIDMCATDWQGRKLDRQSWLNLAHLAAAKGQRVLALAASQPFDFEHQLPAANHASLESILHSGQLRLLGLVAIIDPPKPQSLAAIEQCRLAGIQVKMITGDHQATAAAIAIQLGLNEKNALTGAEVETLSDELLSQRLGETDVIARATPEHKLRLIRALQTNGQMVAMTGDGVNDAPALKAADIGVAMGQRGTAVAKEAADIVLLDDEIGTIVTAIQQGRVVFDNIKKSVLFLLATDLSAATLIVLAVLFGFSLPVTPTQILWINLVTSVTLSFALVFEKAEANVMARGPNPRARSLITGRMLFRIVFFSTLVVLAAFAVFFAELARGSNVETAQTAAVLMLVLAEIAHMFNVRRFTASALAFKGFFENRTVFTVILALLIMQLAFTYWQPLNVAFDSRPLDLYSWGLTLALAIAIFLVVEIEKLVRRRLGMFGF